MPRLTRDQRPGRHLLIATLLCGAALLGCPSSGKDGGPDGGQQLPDGGQQLPDGGPISGSAEALCVEGWCWENPRPMGLRLSAVWMDTSGKGWVGGRRTGLLYWDGTRFTPTALPAAAAWEVTSLWGSAPDDVWAVAGVLLHFDGQKWSVDERAGINLTAVWGTGASDVWATGYGRILHFDGSTWTQAQSAPAAFTAIHGTAPDNVWAVGHQGVVHHWDGRAWTASSLGDVNSLLADVWVGAANDVWAAGDYRGMWHFDGASWRSYPSAHPNQVYTTVWGVAGQFVWAGGNAGATAAFNGSAWVQQGFMPTNNLTQLGGRSADDFWAVGEAGFFALGGQSGWRYPALAAPPIEAIFTDVALVEGEGEVQAWVVGPGRLGGDLVARREPGGIWRRDSSIPRLSDAERIAASGPNDIWTRDGEATVHFDGTSWKEVPVPDGAEVVGEICTFGPSEAWALAKAYSGFSDLKVLRWDGTAWSVDATLPDSSISSGEERLRVRLFCLSREEIWVGGPSLLLQRKEGQWQRMGVSYWNASGWSSTAPRLRLRAFGPQDVWAVKPTGGSSTEHSTVVRFDGRDWREVSLPGNPAPLIHDVHGTSGSDVWLAGGAALHWNGSELARVDIGHQGELRLVWAFAPNDVLFVGHDLKTYRWNGSSVTTYTPTQPDYGAKNDAWFASPDFGFLLDDGALLSWDGSKWNPQPVLAGFSPTAIWGFAANDVWLVGHELRVAHWDGSNWTVVDLNGEAYSGEELIRVWGATPQDVWAVGKEGSLFRNTGSGFVQVTPEMPVGPALAIGGTGVNDVWFLGHAAAHWNGAAFSLVETLEHPVRIQRVGGARMAVDVRGAVWRDGEAGFRRLSPDVREVGGTVTFTSAAFVSEAEGYLISESGRAWRFDGTSVKQIEALSTIPPLWEVEALGREVFMVGAFGTVLRKAP